MTLALALRCANGLVMATDSRASTSVGPVADLSEKFLQVNRDIGIMTYGLATPGYRGMRSVVEFVRENLSSVTSMTALVDKARELTRAEHVKFLAEFESRVRSEPTITNPDELIEDMKQQAVGFIIGGFDGNDTALFRIYHTVSTWDFEMFEQENDVLAAQWPLSTTLLPYLQYSGMSVAEGTKLAVILMILTAMHEPSVGGRIHLATVTPEEGFTLLHERETAALIEEVQPALIGIRKAFVDSWCLVRGDQDWNAVASHGVT